MEDFTLLKMEGASVDIMCAISPEYEKFVCYENRKKVLYLELLKALYGCVQLALLWYTLFSGTIKGMCGKYPLLANDGYDGVTTLSL
jgi:hypothetical protein